MSFPKPPVVVSSAALLAALSMVPTQGWARDGRNVGDAIFQIPPMTADESREIIYIMPPMQPVPGMVAKKATKPVEQPVPAIAAKPSPAPVVGEASPAQAPVAAVPNPTGPETPVAEAPKPADVQPPPLAEAPQAPQPQGVAEQPETADANAGVQGDAAAQKAPQPLEGQAEIAPPAEQPVAQAPEVVEPALVGPPVMTINKPRKALAALRQPMAALDAQLLQPQGEYLGRGLVPVLDSLARNEAPAQAQVAPAQTQMAPAPVAEAPIASTGAEAVAPEPTPADPAVAAAEVEARISAVLSEGVVGPAEVRVGDRATIWLPANRVFLSAEPAKKLAKEAGLEWRVGVQGLIAPSGGKLQWLAPVEVLDDGYVRSDDAAALQPEKLLAAFEAGLPEMNAQRERVGQPPVALGGWLVAPQLTAKHRLSACVNIATKDGGNGVDSFFNCEAWSLGRQGAIKITLADGGEEAARLKGEAAALADTVVFDRGQTYEDFNSATDKVAPYAAADLLTRDVTVQAAAAPPAALEAAGEPSSPLSKLLLPALLALAAFGGYVFLKRRKSAEATGAQEAEAPFEDSPVETHHTPEAATSLLFKRMLPTLHARFAKRAVAPVPDELQAAAQVVADASAEKPGAGSLMGKLSSLRVLVKKGEPGVVATIHAAENSAAETPAAKAPSSAAGKAEAADEPASALKKLATLMRRSSDEAPPSPVNVARAMRPVRTLPGAAPAVAEEFAAPEIAQPIIVQPAAEEKIPETPSFEELKLVEPGQQFVEPEMFQRPVEEKIVEAAKVEDSPRVRTPPGVQGASNDRGGEKPLG